MIRANIDKGRLSNGIDDDMENVVLIGMPGCGKSTIGVVLAKVLGYSFIDSDLLIQEHENRLLSEIIEDTDPDTFIQIENDIIMSINTNKTVIATGGSVVYGTSAIKHLRDIGVLIYLNLPYAEIENRVGNLAHRGVLIRKDQTLKSLYDERIPLYEQNAHLTVDVEGKTIREAVASIKEQYEKYLKVQ